MTFEEIIQQSKERQFAFLINGIQANILLLALEMILSHPPEMMSEGMLDILNATRKNILNVIRDHRFITLGELQKLSDQLNEAQELGDPMDLKALIEKIWNSRV